MLNGITRTMPRKGVGPYAGGFDTYRDICANVEAMGHTGFILDNAGTLETSLMPMSASIA